MSLTGDLVPSAPAGGIVFTGCAMQNAAPAGGSPPQAHDHAHARRREVVVNGKRVKTIDVHAHCCVPAAMALIKHP
ncbi:MAG: aminocarboxymuconate-semialdehyde decarboxylase, partial [Rhodospirillaceae bacterium]|nr:aminocarboxymuconate-semialdehyde decarboxylase [Rhodospirillaceae bacterium]